MHFKHVETAEDYRYQLPFEADKSKSIAEMTLDELRRLNQRLSLERETQGIILDLRRNSGERYDYDHPPQIDTQTPVEQLYHDAELTHYGVLGMKWGVRKERSVNGTTKTSRDQQIKEARKQTSKARRYLSDGDLKKAVDRLQMEKKLKDLTNDDVSPGKTKAAQILKQVGTTAVTAAGTAVATYAIKAALQGNFNVKEAATFIRPKK